MIIERNFTKFVVFAEDSLLSALNKISDNKTRIVFAVAESGRLEGAIADGDLRRWLMTTPNIDLNQSVSSMMNRNCLTASATSTPANIETLFSDKVSTIPLLDINQRLVGVAIRGYQLCKLGSRIISENMPSFIIAEIGNNHNGSLELAKNLVDEAVLTGADCAKFQMRDMSTLYSNAGNANDCSVDLGTQYTLDLLSRFQLPDDEMFELFDYCRINDIIPLCTPWDISSLNKLEQYGMEGYKVSSADLTNYDLIDAILATGKFMICSTGMATEIEIQNSVKRLQQAGRPFVLLHCNSTYPAPFKDINLHYMLHLKETYECMIGYSGHERDINVALAAATLGAKVIEKHFTLDRGMEGNDHKVSLLPSEFSQMVKGIRQIEESLGKVSQRTLSQGEMMNREVLAKSLIAAVDIPIGVPVTEKMIEIRSPGQGLQPNRKQDLIGRVLTHTKIAGENFTPSDIGEGRAKARHYTFTRPWGVPVRYHDLQKMLSKSNMDILEIHLSYKDMEFDFNEFIPAPLSQGLVVHAPELFQGDHTLDLCSQDDAYRERSLKEMQRVIDLTRSLNQRFPSTTKPCIVTNVGGFSHSGHIKNEECEVLYTRLEESLLKLDSDGVEIIPQTMPPFPWHFGGQQFHNLFVNIDDIVRFCKRNNMRVCLDVSHSKLACTYLKHSFTEFMREIMPFVAHMHLADASGVDGEGLQIDEGEIDWLAVGKIINEMNPTASFIPEIWQGHKNDGEEAWLAMERLEHILNMKTHN
jgi:sialic acid synthase SpsE/sugar phosphate isomerase/epimerase